MAVRNYTFLLRNIRIPCMKKIKKALDLLSGFSYSLLTPTER